MDVLTARRLTLARNLRAAIATVAAGAATLIAAAALAQSAEYQIKAAFLCKFGNYIEWPQRPNAATFGIGVVASGAVLDELTRTAQGQTVDGRPIDVKVFNPGDPVDGLDILFVDRAHATRVPEVLAAVKDQPILTVTELDPGAVSGSMVNFVVVDDKVKFDIALAPAQTSRLKISARLLGVARVVTGRTS